MKKCKGISVIILGLFVFLGITILGIFLYTSVIKFKSMDRTVVVKGLSEKEFKANIVIWPINFTETDKNLIKLYNDIEKRTKQIETFLIQNGISKDEITISSPHITDKKANRYLNDMSNDNSSRYIATQTITVYSSKVEKVRSLITQISKLGKNGIVFTGNDYQIEYKFTKLNEVKPEMIEESTKNAREVAIKFANDSQSKLGKIKKARQGQFSIYSRDSNNPHIKTVRVVSTIEYYLSD